MFYLTTHSTRVIYGYGRKCCFLMNVQIQQFVPRNMHIRQPLGKCFDKKLVVATLKQPPRQMICRATSFRGTAGMYVIPTGTNMNGPKHVELLKKVKLHDHNAWLNVLHARWCSLSAIKDSH